MKIKKSVKLAIVSTHPIQYFSPWFRYLQTTAEKRKKGEKGDRSWEMGDRGVFVCLQGQGRLVKGWAISLFLFFPVGLWFLEGSTDRTGMMAGAAGFGLLLCLLRRWDEDLIRWRPVHGLRQVGLFSYSLYLVHVPFGGAFRNLAMRFVSETSPEFLLVQIGYVAVCVATALIFYRLIEAPWEKFRKSTFC